MKQAEVLFDGRQFETDPRLRIPEYMGRHQGEFFSAWRYVHVYTEHDAPHVFEPAGQDAQMTAHGYAANEPNFARDFIHWQERKPATSSFRGYLVGFPQIHDVDDTSRYDCLHIWGNNADVFTGNYAIPLRSLMGLYVFSELRTSIEIDMDNIAMGDQESRFAVPLLQDRKSGTVHYRAARHEDLEKVIEDIDEDPVQVYGQGFEEQSYRVFTRHSQLLTFLGLASIESIEASEHQ